MPTTPALWRDDFQVNINPNGTQDEPVITQLASGFILVVWTDSDNSSVPGSPAGRDIIGRIFDPLGNLVTAEFRLNTFSSADNEHDPSITALAGGGFMVTYDRIGAFDDLYYETYSFNSATGGVSHENDGFIHFDAGAGSGGAVVASASASSTMTVYATPDANETDVSDLFVRAYNPVTDTISAPVQLTDANSQLDGSIADTDICALSNGNYAIFYLQGLFGGGPVNFRVVNAAGGPVASGTAAAFASSGSIAALDDGFVLTWRDGDDILFRIYNNAGQAQIPAFPAGVPTLANEQGWPDVAALADGSLVIVWVDLTLNQLRGQRYSDSGMAIGAEFIVEQLTGVGAADARPEVEAFEDGRFAVTWDDSNNVRMKFFDIRDAPGGGNFYTPDQWQIGTAGNDTMTTAGSTEVVNGWTGNDTITGSFSGDEIYGDTGNDTLSGFGGNDVLIGGSGNDVLEGGLGADTLNGAGSFVFATESDTASYANSNAAVNVNLTTGVGTGGHAQGDTLSAIEHLIGSAFNDTLVGNTGGNTLNGGAGNDALNGGAGNDTLNGWTGNDSMRGGAGSDTYIVHNAGDIVDESIAGSAGNDYVQSYLSFNLANAATAKGNVENLLLLGSTNINATGNALNNLLKGNSGNNLLNGSTGTDVIHGMAGKDSFFFNSTLGPTNVDIITDFSVPDDTITLENAIFTTLGTVGPLAASAFHIGAAAADALDRIIYNNVTGALIYDSNGSAAGGATQFATLSAGLAMTNADFFVV